jgi:hypothetical protein
METRNLTWMNRMDRIKPNYKEVLLSCASCSSMLNFLFLG